MTSYILIALHSPVIRHPRTVRKPSPKKDLLAIPTGLLVARVAGYEKRPVRTNPIQNWALSICLPGSGVWPLSFYLRSTHYGRPPLHMQHLITLSGDHTTCYLPPWASIYWITSFLTDSSYRCFPCTTAPLIHTILCCTLTRQ